MSNWTIKRTDTFLNHLKEHRKHHELLKELDNRLKRLKEDPETVGGHLSGSLHSRKSTRLTKKFRLIFRIDSELKVVYLVALDHRGKVY